MIKHGPFSNVASLSEARTAKEHAARARQDEVDRALATPDSEEAARDLSLHVTTEDLTQTLGVGIMPAPEGTRAWLLTPDQADAFALQVIRNAAEARRWEANGGKKP